MPQIRQSGFVLIFFITNQVSTLHTFYTGTQGNNNSIFSDEESLINCRVLFCLLHYFCYMKKPMTAGCLFVETKF